MGEIGSRAIHRCVLFFSLSLSLSLSSDEIITRAFVLFSNLSSSRFERNTRERRERKV
jgi:hypothetical protein